MGACVICSTEKKPKPALDGKLTCFSCSNRILRHLRELEEYLPTLSVEKAVTGDSGRKTGFGPRSPASDTVIVHTDPRSGTEVTVDQHGNVSAEYSALGVATSWAQLVAEERGVNPEAGMLALSMLRRNHDWITRQPWLDEYAMELRQVHSAVRALAHDPVPRSVGRCITIYTDKRGECRGDVYELDDASGVRCSVCRRTYTGLDLDRLRVAQEATG